MLVGTWMMSDDRRPMSDDRRPRLRWTHDPVLCGPVLIPLHHGDWLIFVIDSSNRNLWYHGHAKIGESYMKKPGLRTQSSPCLIVEWKASDWSPPPTLETFTHALVPVKSEKHLNYLKKTKLLGCVMYIMVTIIFLLENGPNGFKKYSNIRTRQLGHPRTPANRFRN